jgi:hypothetical protein
MEDERLPVAFLEIRLLDQKGESLMKKKFRSRRGVTYVSRAGALATLNDSTRWLISRFREIRDAEEVEAYALENQADLFNGD